MKGVKTLKAVHVHAYEKGIIEENETCLSGVHFSRLCIKGYELHEAENKSPYIFYFHKRE